MTQSILLTARHHLEADDKCGFTKKEKTAKNRKTFCKKKKFQHKEEPAPLAFCRHIHSFAAGMSIV